MSSGGLAALGTNNITLEDVAARLTRGAAGAEAGEGWEDWQIRGATESGESTEGRVRSLHRLGVRVGCGAAAMGRVQALGVAGGSAGVEAAVASLTTSDGLLLNTCGLAAEWVDGLSLLDATVGVTRSAAGPETNGDGWEDRQMWGATDDGDGRVGSLH